MAASRSLLYLLLVAIGSAPSARRAWWAVRISSARSDCVRFAMSACVPGLCCVQLGFEAAGRPLGLCVPFFLFPLRPERFGRGLGRRVLVGLACPGFVSWP